MSTPGEPISGVVERITFHNLDNGYAVLKVRAPKHRDLVTVVGTLSNVVAGEYIEARGSWVTDRTHGLQFKADELRTTPPHTAEGIAKYLGSGLIKGIGPTYAKRIVEVFGDRTLDVIDQSPTFLSEVKGIGPQRLERIRRSWEEQKGVRSIMVFLQSYGIGTARAVRIYKQYGDNAIDLVKSNPYRLTTDIWGVGFKTADELATRLGLPKDSPLRARAAVRYILQDLGTKGHVGYPEHGVVDETMRLTNIAPDVIREAIEAGRQEDELVRDRGPAPTPDAAEEDWLYLKPLFLAEIGVARAIRALSQGDHPLPEIKIEAALEWVQRKMGLELAPTQRDAIEAATRDKVLVITGGPGVGKTTIVRGLIEIFGAKGQRIALAAPTGRAAKRLSESTGREARTIHRLLEFDPGIGRFKRDRDNPLEADLLVVDEASMVDVVLMNQLLRAVPAWCCVVFVGDVDQLPSVGPGTVLRDLIDSGVVRVVRLTQIFRQAGASYIVRAAHAINSGLEPESAPSANGDFFFVEADTPEAITDKLITMVRDRIPARFGLDPFRDVQVLSPMNKSELGVNILNQRLQEVLNPPAAGVRQVERFGRTFRVGDKVIQVQNDYQKEVFNGDIGRIMSLDPVDQELVVDYDGREVPYDFNELDELAQAYCISIHKCVAGYGLTAVRGRGLIPASDVGVGDAIQTGRGTDRAVLARVAVGSKPIVRVRTRCGYAIDVSAEHPILVATEERGPHFRRADDLGPGTFACIDRTPAAGGSVALPAIAYQPTQKPQKRVSPPAELDEDFAWALGVIIGDGCCRDQRDGMIDVTSQDEEVIQAYRAVFERIGLSVTVRPVGNVCRVYFCSVPFRRWLSALGLGYHLGPDKRTPSVVFRAGERVRAAYLRGLFDTDGSAGRINVRYTTASPALAAEVQHLLLSLGIVSIRNAQNDRHHKVTISGPAVRVFRERVGFTVARKRSRLDELAARAGRQEKTNIDIVPFGRAVVRELRAAIPIARGVRGRGLFANGDRSGGCALDILRGAHRTSYAHLRRIAAKLMAEGTPLPACADTVLRENYFFDPVVSVEFVPESAEMFDLEVEDQHSFVVNGFVCHNSQGSEYPAVVIPLHTQHYVMLQRNLLYTGVTRGKKLVALVGSRKALGIAVLKQDTAFRYSMLRQRLKAADAADAPPR